VYVTFADGTHGDYEDTPFSKGGQGEIYMARDKLSVLKLYFQQIATPERMKRVDAMIGQYNATEGDPYWDELFTWPQKRAVAPRPGLRMRFVRDLTRMDHYMFGQAFNSLAAEKKGWWIGRVASAIKLARAVNRMSNKGLCHSDLSDRNVMVDPFSGRATVLDCDSIVVPNVLPAEVYGTLEYMAPELIMDMVRHNSPSASVATDRHPLAVLLYRWLLNRHPLLGPKQHDPDPVVDEFMALSVGALFIENPDDHSNRPPSLRQTSDSLGPRMHDLFHRAFIDGLQNPGRRPTADAWEEALIEMLDRIIPCDNSACQQRFFVAPDVGPLRCPNPNCGTLVDFPERIPYLKLRAPRHQRGQIVYVDEDIYPKYIVGWPARPLYAWHAEPSIRSVPTPTGARPSTKPVAMLLFDAGQRQWYLENLALPHMQVGTAHGAQVNWQPVPISARVPLRPHLQILFGQHNVARIAYIELRRVV
jgi:hypothetical protein